MIARSNLFKKQHIAIAVSAGLFVLAGNAQALTLNADAAVTLPGSATVTVEDLNQSTAANAYLYESDAATGNNGRAAGKGRDDGWMYSFAGGSGAFDAQGHIQQVIDFTNTTGVAQQYTYDFTINFGYIEATYDGIFGAGEFVEAGNNISITLDGIDKFTSGATITNNGSGISLVKSGTALSTAGASGGFYSWDTYIGSIDLGVFDAGESFQLEYDITTFASSNISGQVCDFRDEEIDFRFTEAEFGDGLEVLESCVTNYAYSHFGDPNFIAGIPQSPAGLGGVITAQPAATVPVPGTLLLLGGGVFGLLLARRQQRNSN